MGSCCKTINSDKQCEVLKQRLRDYYRSLVLPRPAYLEEGMDLLIHEHFIHLELHESQKSINIEEIFSSGVNKRPFRILIESQPGFGKTTLAIKLTHDWATAKEYMTHFEFAFLIPLRELQNQSINNAIKQIGNRCQCDTAVEIACRHEKTLLLILDGLDEISPEERLEITKILYKQEYHDATVVVTCRTGLFALRKEEKAQLFGSISMRVDFSDKRIRILGVLSDEIKREFLKTFMPQTSVETVIKNLASQWDLFESPLLLMTLAVLLKEGEKIEEFSTKRDLYKKLFNCLIQHSYKKRGREIEPDFDLFNISSTPNAIRDKMQKFGMLAMEKILKQEFQFESDELSNEIYELGFLIHHKVISLDKATNHYEILHLTLMEFAAAYALWLHLKLNKSALIDEYLTSIMNHFIQSAGTSLIMPFVASLMEDDLGHLLSLINSYSPLFAKYYNLSVAFFSECSLINISESKHIVPFISSYMDISVCQNNKKILGEILNRGIECGKIKRILIDEKSKLEILPNQIKTRLEIRFELNSNTELILYSRVPCELPRMISHPIPFKGPLVQCLHFAQSTNCKDCVLEFGDYEKCTEFLELVKKDKTFDKIKYKQLEIEIRTEMEKQVVIKLLENNQVEHLELTVEKIKRNPPLQLLSPISSVLDTSALSLAAANSIHLTMIHLRGVICTTIDLYDLTNGGTKKYIYIGLFDCTLTCKRPLLARNCCHYLQIDNLQNLNGIIAMEPCAFECTPTAAINRLLIQFPAWTGFNTVKTLGTTNQELSEKFLSNNPFIHLQTLNLIVCEDVNLYDLANFIYALPIVNLIIRNYISSHISHLFQRMNELWSGKNNTSRLQTISLFGPEQNCDCESSQVLELLEGLKCCHWNKVNLLHLANFGDIDKLLKFISQWNLLVSVSKLESIYFEPDPFFNHLITCIYQALDTILSITRKCHE
uniref:NACHT domain-containing protein n=1 Tax=Strigamia maritima TaxID=126957 RepID=T1J8B3_STRMM